jgi:hypothetical protein
VGLPRDGDLQVQLGVTDGQISGRIAGRLEIVQMAMSVAGLAFRPKGNATTITLLSTVFYILPRP